MAENLKFCCNCRHFNKFDRGCDHPKNVRRKIEFDLVTGDKLESPRVVRIDSSASSSRVGDTSSTNCGYDGGWYETDLQSMALRALQP